MSNPTTQTEEPSLVGTRLKEADTVIRQLFMGARLEDFPGFCSTVLKRLESETPDQMASARYQAHLVTIPADDEGEAKKSPPAKPLSVRDDVRMLLEIAQADCIMAGAMESEGRSVEAMDYVASAFYCLGMAYERTAVLELARFREYTRNKADIKAAAKLLFDLKPRCGFDSIHAAIKAIAPGFLLHVKARKDAEGKDKPKDKLSRRVIISRKYEDELTEAREKLRPLLKVEQLADVLRVVIKPGQRRAGRPGKPKPFSWEANVKAFLALREAERNSSKTS